MANTYDRYGNRVTTTQGGSSAPSTAVNRSTYTPVGTTNLESDLQGITQDYEEGRGILYDKYRLGEGRDVFTEEFSKNYEQQLYDPSGGYSSEYIKTHWDDMNEFMDPGDVANIFGSYDIDMISDPEMLEKMDTNPWEVAASRLNDMGFDKDAYLQSVADDFYNNQSSYLSGLEGQRSDLQGQIATINRNNSIDKMQNLIDTRLSSGNDAMQQRLEQYTPMIQQAYDQKEQDIERQLGEQRARASIADRARAARDNTLTTGAQRSSEAQREGQYANALSSAMANLGVQEINQLANAEMNAIQANLQNLNMIYQQNRDLLTMEQANYLQDQAAALQEKWNTVNFERQKQLMDIGHGYDMEKAQYQVMLQEAMQPSVFEQLLGPLTQLGGMAIGGAMAGPVGAMVGGTAGGAFGGLGRGSSNMGYAAGYGSSPIEDQAQYSAMYGSPYGWEF